MAEMVITELRRTGSGTDPTPVEFRWTSDTHSSMTNPLALKLNINTMRRMPAGAAQPVEQVMSAEWEAFHVEGEWNDKWAGQGFAQSMRRLFPQMAGRTPLVRFQIDEDSLVGIVKNVQTTYYTRDRVGYSFEFSPHVNEMVGSFQQSANRVPPQPINQRVELALELMDELATVTAAAASDVPVKNFDITDSTTGLNEAAAATDSAAAAVQAGSSRDPVRVLLAAAGAFRRLRGAVQDMFDTVADKRSDITVAYEDAISILKFDEWRCSLNRTAAVALGVSTDAELDLRAKASRKPKAIHHAKAGESLERISLRYYGTADNWVAIFDANNLSSILLEGGELLIIPERTS